MLDDMEGAKRDLFKFGMECISAYQRRLDEAELDMSEWEPIETAPMDGTRILLWFPGSEELVYVGSFDTHEHFLNGRLTGRRCHWNVGTYSWCFNADGTPNRDPQPTHWMPLPEPPR